MTKTPSFSDKNTPPKKPMWKADNGAWRIGRTGDMIAMLDDLGIKNRAF